MRLRAKLTFMKLPNDPNKFTSTFKYVEVARYVPPSEEYPKGNLSRFLRGKKGSAPFMFSPEEVQAYAEKYDNEGIYTSVFQYNNRDFEQASYMSSLYFDLDSSDLSASWSDTKRLYGYLQQFVPEDAIRVYFSGAKGFHIECEALALNTGTSEDLSNIFAFVAHTLADELELTTLDFKVYDIRRMWRLVNSRHQKSGLFKVPCKEIIYSASSVEDIQYYAGEQHFEDVPEQVFSFQANQWYREFVYKYEQSKLAQASSQQDLLTRFLEQGSGNIREYDHEKKFDQYKLFKNCPAVKNIVNKAYENHHLDHYERLFLCSLLTYTPESIEFLHKVLSQCSDYHFEISSSHIQDWIKRREYGIGGRPFTCAKAKQVGIMCSGCDSMEPKKKVMALDGNRYIETEEYSAPSPIRHAYTIPRGIQ